MNANLANERTTLTAITGPPLEEIADYVAAVDAEHLPALRRFLCERLSDEQWLNLDLSTDEPWKLTHSGWAEVIREFKDGELEPLITALAGHQKKSVFDLLKKSRELHDVINHFRDAVLGAPHDEGALAAGAIQSLIEEGEIQGRIKCALQCFSNCEFKAARLLLSDVSDIDLATFKMSPEARAFCNGEPAKGEGTCF